MLHGKGITNSFKSVHENMKMFPFTKLMMMLYPFY
jgi:hypothetical protein